MSMLDYAKYGRLEKNAGALDVLGRGAAVLTGGLLAGGLVRSTYNAIKQDNKARQVFEMLTRDPQLSRIDPGTLAEWFAAIYHYSPTAATDRATAKELMHQFATFGKVDLQTLKTLAEIEEKRTSAYKDMYESKGVGAHVDLANKTLGVARSLWGK